MNRPNAAGGKHAAEMTPIDRDTACGQAFDAWLRQGLEATYRGPVNEPLSAELDALLRQGPSE